MVDTKPATLQWWYDRILEENSRLVQEIRNTNSENLMYSISLNQRLQFVQGKLDMLRSLMQDGRE